MGKRTIVCLCISIILSIVLGCGCDLENRSKPVDTIVVMTYNVQNLFDPYVSGLEYGEFTPEGGWTASAYRDRLERIFRAVTQGHAVNADIIVVQEIEHEGVMRDLIEEKFKARGFRWYAVTADPFSPIQTGILSKYPLTNAKIHGVDGSRSLLEVTVSAHQEQFVVFSLHAKSNKEGIEETAPQRIALMKAIELCVSDIRTSTPHMPILIAGDFNESVDVYFREGQRFQTALIPFDAHNASDFYGMGSLIITGGAPSYNQWYSWWYDKRGQLHAHAPGSYWYKGIWETYDHILLSSGFFDGKGWEYQKSQVCVTHLLDETGTRPYAYNVKTKRGISDHLPLYVILQKQ